MKNIWKLINSILLISVLFYLFFFNEKSNKEIVFIDNVKVFQEFNMTKELGVVNEKKYKHQLTSFDSLVTQFSELETILKSKKKITKEEKQQYIKEQRKVIQKEKEIEEIRINVKNDINNKVWTRLNSYINSYGKEKKLKLILGAQGSGNIMYGDSITDRTSDFVEYVNYKYEGN